MVETIVVAAAVSVLVSAPVAWFAGTRAANQERKNYKPLPEPANRKAPRTKVEAAQMTSPPEVVTKLEPKPPVRRLTWRQIAREAEAESEAS